MSYKNFKEKDFKDKFGITTKIGLIFKREELITFEPSQNLIFALQDARLITLSTEKAVSERVISPVLAEIKRKFPDRVQIFSGEIINADSKQGLNGEIDFIITKATNTIEPQSPILCVTEAKIGKLNKAIPQATAQMLGARIFNKNHDTDFPTIHGVVTDGDVWLFLKLEENTLYLDDTRYYINDLPILLGIFNKIIEFYEK